jgi:hypothetical protein
MFCRERWSAAELPLGLGLRRQTWAAARHVEINYEETHHLHEHSMNTDVEIISLQPHSHS